MRNNYNHTIQESEGKGVFYIMSSSKITHICYSLKSAKAYLEALGRHK